MITFQEIFTAYKKCRLRKKYSRQKAFFEMHLSKELVSLVDDLNTKKYKLAPSNFFMILHPKPREIFAAHFRDRIVHHYLVSKLTSIWEKKFSHASFACRNNKGTHAAINYVRNKVHTISAGGTKQVYVLQMDIKNFFASIHRPTLVALYHKHNPDKSISWLIDTVIGADTRKNIRKFAKSPLQQQHCTKFTHSGKSWFLKPDDSGIPIGNLSSQFGANIYLNDFDHHVQRILKPQQYLRYVDDLIFIDTDKQKLESMIQPVTNWLAEYRKMEIHPEKTKLTSLKNGIDILGYHLKQIGRVEPEKRNKNSTLLLTQKSKKWTLINSVKALNQKGILTTEPLNPFLYTRIPCKKVTKQFASINSKLGHIKHAKNYQFRKSLIERLIFDTSFYDFDVDLEKQICWSIIRTQKNYGSIKKSARIVKITGR